MFRARRKVIDVLRLRKKSLAIRYLNFENEKNVEECNAILLKGVECDMLDDKLKVSRNTNKSNTRKFREVLQAMRDKKEAEGEDQE